ncbi:MAG: hypothetical protein E7345_03140 [Clostridiales bacterium]|nr:hypothetical protein [Clostridiales bacterium]
MIVNGNYEFFNFHKHKDKFIEAFVQFYGEEYREIITYRINEINYHPFHSEEYVSYKYQEYLKTFKDEINKRLLEKYGLPKNGVRENIILSDKYKDMWICLLGGQFFESVDINEEEKQKIRDVRKLITDEFNLSTESETSNFLDILKFRKNYVDIVRDIEKEYSCEVFRDIDYYDKYYPFVIKFVERKSKEAGYLGEIINSDTINPIEKMSEKILFGGDITVPGLISAFTTHSNEIVDYREDKNADRLFIICQRLEYLSLIGVELKYIDKDYIYDISTEEDVDRILKEYEYQVYNYNIPEKFDYSKNFKNYKKNYKYGEFIPTKLADEIENIRINELAEFYCKPRFSGSLRKDEWFKKIKDDEKNGITLEFFSNTFFRNNKIYDLRRNIFINEDPNYSMEDFIRNLIHEINHCVSFQFKENIEEVRIREGLDECYFKINNNLNVGRYCEYTNDALCLAEETVNELQASEIYDIFISLFPDFIIPNYEDNDNKSYCNYTNYNFILEDFYNLYKDDILRAKVDIDYNLYRSHDLTCGMVSSYINYFKHKIKNKIKPDGVIDFFKFCELANLTIEFKQEVCPYLDELFTPDLLSDEKFLNSIPADVLDKIFDIIRRKSKIMEQLIRECPPKISYQFEDEMN